MVFILLQVLKEELQLQQKLRLQQVLKDSLEEHRATVITSFLEKRKGFVFLFSVCCVGGLFCYKFLEEELRLQQKLRLQQVLEDSLEERVDVVCVNNANV